MAPDPIPPLHATANDPMSTRILHTALLLGALAGAAGAQTKAAPKPVSQGQLLDNHDAAARAARLAQTGTLGFEPLPDLRVDSPRDQLIFADRFPSAMQEASYAGTAPVMVDGFIPAGGGGTGTIFPEIFKYQLPVSYDEFGDPVPMVIAYHGFGMSANSVALFSEIDEECNNRGWVYMAPTGLDDQLFGSPISQQHVEAAIQYMLDNYNIDQDRLYMVGFSMGGGVATSFAARHRDPSGQMIAAVGTVSPTMDWTQTFLLGTTATQTLMINQYNFGDTPSQVPWKYKQVSGLYFDRNTYPPLPGVLVPEDSMATNLAGIPTYLTWDTGDTLPEVLSTAPVFESVLLNAGATVQTAIKSGTVDGDGDPATHSWWVLDEVELFDFFDGKKVKRYPTDFDGQQDLGGALSWATSTQDQTDAFTYLVGDADRPNEEIDLSGVANASEVSVRVGKTGILGLPRVSAAADVGEDYQLVLTELSQRPAYLVDHSTGALITGVDSDPLTDSLIVEMAGGSSIDVDVVHDPDWTSNLTSSPNPVAIGATATVDIDCPPDATGAWLIVSITEQLLVVKGMTLVASPIPPALLFWLPLDINGDTSFPAPIPYEPSLQGVRIPIQTLALDGTNLPTSVSNLWGFRIE